MPTFETVLPRLAAAYETGRLVPFIGSGMSVPLCTDWWTFVHRLESQAAGKHVRPYRKDTSREDLIRRANNAVRELRSRKPGAFPAAVRHALLRNRMAAEIPPQTVALAGFRWPLVVSTNYDNCYTAAHGKQRPPRPLAVVGRSEEDCQRVLNSLTVAGRSVLWAIQGYLDTPFRIADPPGTDVDARQRADAALQGQLVVGHEEYRRVTYGALHFRRAFAEVFRQRSLLFLGAAIQEPYLQELFGEILEYYGPSTRPHYAFIKKDQVDPDFMLSRFQIVAVEYDDHREVITRLERLAAMVKRPQRAAVSWSWGRIVPLADDHWTSVPDLEVVRGPLPDQHVRGQCLAVSAGGSDGRFYFSEGIGRVMRAWHAEPDEPPAPLSPYVGEYRGRDVFGVRARSAGDERSLADIYDASLDLFNRTGHRYRRIHMQLLATGGTDKRGVSDHEWKVRTYPERFSFIQTVRAWGAWRESHPDTDCRLTLHVVLDVIYLDVASGRLDVLELLTSRDLRFFVEIVGDNGRLERRLFQMMPDVRIRDVIEQLQLASRYWTMTVTPPPSIELIENEPVRSQLEATLQTLGVVPGSTIHFRRIDPDAIDPRRSTSSSHRRRSFRASRSRR
jgi:SIR2-like protein